MQLYYEMMLQQGSLHLRITEKQEAGPPRNRPASGAISSSALGIKKFTSNSAIYRGKKSYVESS